MNPIWALLFKDRIRTPFSVYRMSLAEIVVLGGIIFGIGFSVVLGGQWLINAISPASAIVVETK